MVSFKSTCAVALMFVVCAQACIYEFGNRNEAAALAGGHYTYAYNGLDWVNSFETCRGEKQSPILLPASGAAAKQLGKPVAKSTFSYGQLTNGKVINNGHTLQVSLPADYSSDVMIPVAGDANKATGTSIVNADNKAEIKMVKATPAQFHFHTHSEHVISGATYPLEMHIVHFIKKDQLPACGDAGCPAVLGIMFALTRDENEVSPAVRRVIEAMPLGEGQNGTIPGTIDVNNLLPKDRSYFLYQGSLTTPPCSEGILWHLLTTPMKISQSLLTRFQEAVGDYSCPEKGAAAAKKVVSEQAEKDVFALPQKDAEGCVKMANGHNYRAVQPINGRTILLAA